MASGKPFLAKAASIWAEWRSLHDQLCGSMATAVNILTRLQVLQRPQCFGVLEGDKEVQAAVLDKQLESLDGCLAAMQTTLTLMAGVTREQERLSSQASMQLAVPAALPAGLEARGAEPSVVQALEAVQDLRQQLCDELVVQQVLVAQITLQATADDLHAVLACCQYQPNVDTVGFEALLRQASVAWEWKPASG